MIGSRHRFDISDSCRFGMCGKCDARARTKLRGVQDDGLCSGGPGSASRGKGHSTENAPSKCFAIYSACIHARCGCYLAPAALNSEFYGVVDAYDQPLKAATELFRGPFLPVLAKMTLKARQMSLGSPSITSEGAHVDKRRNSFNPQASQATNCGLGPFDDADRRYFGRGHRPECSFVISSVQTSTHFWGVSRGSKRQNRTHPRQVNL